MVLLFCLLGAGCKIKGQNVQMGESVKIETEPGCYKIYTCEGDGVVNQHIRCVVHNYYPKS